MNQIITSPFGHRDKNDFKLYNTRRYGGWNLENIRIEIKDEGWIEVYANEVHYASFSHWDAKSYRWEDSMLDRYDLEGKTVDDITELICGNLFNWIFRIKKTRVVKWDVYLRDKNSITPFHLKTSNWTIKNWD